MAWFLASLPFWIMGLFWFSCGGACLVYRRDNETMKTQVEQFLCCFALGAFLWIVAAILC